MFVHPKWNPVIFNIGPICFRWYGLMYFLGFVGGVIICYLQCKYNKHFQKQGWKVSDVDGLLTPMILGIIFGARFGYVFLYKFSYYCAHPLKILTIWEGGMSFHGGLIGVIISLFVYCIIKQLSFFQITDFIVPAIPFGLAVGRLGNFINGELWGRVTDYNIFWAVGFPQARFDDFLWLLHHPEHLMKLGIDGICETCQILLPRHPSQLYEMMLEGIFLFIILFVLSKKSRPVGFLTAVFIGYYGVVRFILEFTREPDMHLGLLAFNLSMGQLLSVPMIVAGFCLIYFSAKSDIL